MLQHGGESVTLLWLLDLHRLIMYRKDEIDWKALSDQANLFGGVVLYIRLYLL